MINQKKLRHPFQSVNYSLTFTPVNSTKPFILLGSMNSTIFGWLLTVESLRTDAQRLNVLRNARSYSRIWLVHTRQRSPLVQLFRQASYLHVCHSRDVICICMSRYRKTEYLGHFMRSFRPRHRHSYALQCIHERKIRQQYYQKISATCRVS